MIIALSLPVFLGGAALAIDTIQWSLATRQMQRQADSGAIAGAFALAQGRNVTSNVNSDLARNNFVTLTVTPVIENAPTVGPKAGNAKAVRVVVATTMKLPFSGMFIRGMPLSAEATAQVVGQGEYCVIALDNGNTTAIKMSGSTSLDLNCGLMSNSVSATAAITAGGSSTIKASPIAAVGGVPASSNYLPPVSLFPYAVPAQDPFAALPDPLSTIGNGSALNVAPNGTKSIGPGTYKSVDIKGTLNMSPGVYYINGGSFSANSQATIIGTGVVIILTSSTAATNPSSIATADINGSANIQLTAPTSGTYAGVLMYQDRRALDSGTNKVNGNSTSILQGALYFPKQELEFTGTTGMQTNCLQMVAKRMTFIGNSSVSNVCPPNSGAASIPGTVIRLVA
ncbi:MAG: Tad domain-containing protein [Sandarakinorhabdus sp.]|nr:Tad domain-containing protein [Sandarakinorhabdus sp.]